MDGSCVQTAGCEWPPLSKSWLVKCWPSVVGEESKCRRELIVELGSCGHLFSNAECSFRNSFCTPVPSGLEFTWANHCLAAGFYLWNFLKGFPFVNITLTPIAEDFCCWFVFATHVHVRWMAEKQAAFADRPCCWHCCLHVWNDTAPQSVPGLSNHSNSLLCCHQGWSKSVTTGNLQHLFEKLAKPLQNQQSCKAYTGWLHTAGAVNTL